MNNWGKNAHTIKFLYKEILKNKGKIKNVKNFRLSWNIQGSSKYSTWMINLVDINKVEKDKVYYNVC